MRTFRMKNMRKYIMNTFVKEKIQDQYLYSVKPDTTITLERYLSSHEEVKTPTVYDGKIVSELGLFTYSGKEEIVQLSIPEGIERIG